MNIEEVRNYCLQLPNATESLPFDDVTLVFKVEGKMFLVLPLDAPMPTLSVKCDPDEAERLRSRYDAVEPAYHFNKKHWNAIRLDSDMPDAEICRWIDHSYREVLRKLPRRIRQAYGL